MFSNLLSIRLRRLVQQVLRRHQHSRCAETALQSVAVAERGLQIGDFTAVGQSLDRLNRCIFRLNRQDQAGANDLAAVPPVASDAPAPAVSAEQPDRAADDAELLAAASDLAATLPTEADFDRKLCPDGACVGVIGADGRCKVCGKAGE